MAKLDYWQRRQAEDMVRYIQSADDTADDIALLYQQASSYIAGKVDDIFEKYQSKHSLSEQEALLLLNTMQDKTSLEELLEKLRSGNADENKKELLAKLESPAYRARIEHFKELQGQIDDIAVRIYRQDKRQTSHYEELAQEAYYRSTYNVRQNTGIDFEFSDVKAKTIEQVINRRWSGKNYSERIWKNMQELAQDLKQELLINLVTGRSNREAAIAIQKKYATGSMEARRLIWTESSYVATEMNAIAYEKMGIEKYRFCAVLDLKTSVICREMDTKEFMLKDRVPGKNCPPMHPWCRSCIIPVIDGATTDRLTRRTRDPVTHKVVKVPYDMTYKQWYEKNVKGKPQVQVEEKKLKNMTSDRKQWQKYRTILKDKIPDSLDKFQDMKYNKTDTWNALKLSFRKTSNANTAFKSLSEPMQLKHVHKVLSEMGIDFENAKIKIERNPELIGKGYFGWTNPNMKEIQLYPDAFSSREELVKTLGHERIHLEQLRNWGPAKTNDEAVYYEKGPKISEDYWWNEYRRSINYDGRKSD